MLRQMNLIPILALSDQRVIGLPEADAEEALAFGATRVPARFDHSVLGFTDRPKPSVRVPGSACPSFTASRGVKAAQ